MNLPLPRTDADAPPPDNSSFPPGKGPSRGVTPRALILAVLLSIVCGLWVREAEIIVASSQITESVPPIPALGVLMLLIALGPLLRGLGDRWGLSRQETLVIYCFVAVATGLSACSVIRFVVNIIATPFYYDTPQNHFSSLWHLLPGWLVVKDPQVVKRMYEASPSGPVPWQFWLVPVLCWSVFILVFWVCMLCLVYIVRQRWVEAERLSFPIIALPLEATGTGEGGRPFFRNPVMWAGFGLAALYNLVNIAHVLSPAVPFLDKHLDLTPHLVNAPYKSLAPISLEFQPELIGFGFLVPLDISFSMWFFYLVSKVEALVMVTHGLDVAGVPFDQEQAMGAFLLLGGWFLWQVRRDIARPFKNLWLPRSQRNLDAPLWPVLGFVACFAFLSLFLGAAGMAIWAAVAYLAIVLLTALVSARIRAEAGVPLIWLFPFGQQKLFLLTVFGAGMLGPAAAPATLAILYLITWLARGFYPAYIGYQIESLKIADEVNIPRTRMAWTLIGAAIVGLVIAWLIHLPTYYTHGAAHMDGALWGTWFSRPEFQSVLTAQGAHPPRDVHRLWAYAAGAAVTVVLLIFRQHVTGFPLHPLGFAAANSYGYLTWWPFLVVWVIKALILRYGGIGLYRRAVPGFLGFALGHLFVAGVLWGLLGVFWPAAVKAYSVYFG